VELLWGKSDFFAVCLYAGLLLPIERKQCSIP